MLADKSDSCTGTYNISEEVGHAWPLANSSLIKSLVLAFVKVLENIVVIFELSAIDLVGEPLLVSTVEQFLASLECQLAALINIPKT